MAQFFQMIANFWISLFDLMEHYKFSIGNFQVSYFSLVFAGLSICIVISVFWRGAKA